jgi:site-specific DNA-methyltransferase (adenine-specific)
MKIELDHSHSKSISGVAGLYETGGMKVPRLQILTAAQILDNRRPQVPFGFTEGFKKAEREKSGGQGELL